jgi:MoaA/NifB/PqqE/SkfB family radical SAM enzyme
MYKLDEIWSIQLEPSSFCNARCVSCVRNVGGYNHNTGFEERNLSLSDIKTILPVSFIKQLNNVLYNGNLGDMLMNPEIVEITAYFLDLNPQLKIQAMTNGGAGSSAMWRGLGNLGIQCNFAIDGLEDTHHLYRQNTVWSTVIKNAKIFIESGGYAVWKMIEFEHNHHQIEECRNLSKELGFREFWLLESSINRGPRIAFDANGNFSHYIESAAEIFNAKMSASQYLDGIKQTFPTVYMKTIQDQTERTITCSAKKMKDLYINSVGEVYPCCFIGHQPKTLDAEHYFSNMQVKEMLKNNLNNALIHPLEQCIEWFSLIEQTWNRSSVKDGGLIACHSNCGKTNYWWDDQKRVNEL